jgi:squalene cyclase
MRVAPVLPVHIFIESPATHATMHGLNLQRAEAPLMRRTLLIVTALASYLGFAFAASATPPDGVKAAVTKSVALLEKSAAEYMVQRKCFSCHHQALHMLTFTAAKERGFAVNEKEITRQLKFTAEFLAKNRENYAMGKGQGGQADTAGYALWTLAAGGWKADETTDAVVEYLLVRDKQRDHWQATSQRPPSEASPFTTTYLALQALQKFGPEEKKDAIDARIDKARKWLLATKPKDTEDRVFRLRALKAVGVGEKEIESVAQELLKMQRPDGGWSQIDKLDSDAYATGSALAALHQAAGLSTEDDAYQRGVQFLLKTQHPDGSWHIRSRSKPFQTYFESGFPHAKDQFISSAGSSWATIALLLTCEVRKEPRTK